MPLSIARIVVLVTLVALCTPSAMGCCGEPVAVARGAGGVSVLAPGPAAAGALDARAFPCDAHLKGRAARTAHTARTAHKAPLGRALAQAAQRDATSHDPRRDVPHGAMAAEESGRHDAAGPCPPDCEDCAAAIEDPAAPAAAAAGRLARTGQDDDTPDATAARIMVPPPPAPPSSRTRWRARPPASPSPLAVHPLDLGQYLRL